MRPARCGSKDPAHVSRRCLECKRFYRRRHRLGQPLGPRYYKNPASCVFCGLAQGNSLEVKVLRYPLLRHIDTGGRHTSVCIGSMAMCDQCVQEFATLNERLQRKAA